MSTEEPGAVDAVITIKVVRTDGTVDVWSDAINGYAEEDGKYVIIEHKDWFPAATNAVTVIYAPGSWATVQIEYTERVTTDASDS